MSGFLMGGLYGLSPSFAARDAATSANRSATAAETVAERMKQTMDRVDKLALVCMAMWSLLQEKTELTEEDLMDRVREIDLADGVEDGKVSKRVVNCPQCARVMHPRHKKCMYCGATELKESAFDDVT